MTVAEVLDRLEIKGVAEGVSDHNRLCFFGVCLFKHGNIYIGIRKLNIDKNGNCTELYHRRYRSRKACRNGDYLVTPFNGSVLEQGGGESHKGDKICA